MLLKALQHQDLTQLHPSNQRAGNIPILIFMILASYSTNSRTHQSQKPLPFVSYIADKLVKL